MRRKTTYSIYVALVIPAVIMLAMALLPQSASGQHYIGVKGGYGGASARFYPAYETSMVWNKYNAGVMWKYYSPQQVVGGVSVELEYMMRGYKLYKESVSDNTTSYNSKTRTVTSITMPLIWQPHLYLAKQRLRLFVNAGFTISYNLGVNETITEFSSVYDKNTGQSTTSTTTTPYKMISARDNRWNYGIVAGLGMGVLFGRCEIFVEGRYYFGMSDILRNKTKYIFNEQGTIRSELDNIFITMGVFFRLGKGGITEPPLRRNKNAYLDNPNDFRNIKLDNMRY